MMKTRKRILSILLSCLLVFSMTACAQTDPGASSQPPDQAGSSSSSQEGGESYAETTESTLDASGYNGAVTSGRKEASEVGVEIMQAGGNAIDAAVGTALAVGFFEPNASGLGGQGFMNIYLADTQEMFFINGRMPAPENIPLDAFKDALNPDGTTNAEGQSKISASGLAVGAPSELMVMSKALENYGTMKLEEIIPYVVAKAEKGIEVSQNLLGHIENAYEYLLEREGGGHIYLTEDGFTPKVGDVIYNEDLVNTLKLIKDQGIDVFYGGEIGQKIVDVVQANGGYLSMEDLMAVKDNVQIIEPSYTTYRDYKIYSSPLPSSGGIIIGEILNILENADVGSMEHNGAEHLNLLAEAMKRGYADRSTVMGDPKFVDVPVDGLLSKEYAKELYDGIGAPLLENTAGDPWAYESQETTSLSVIDSHGNMVVWTKSINSHFGSKLFADGYGFPLTNTLMDFDMKTGTPNAVAPGKTALSSMSPTFVLTPDGKPFIATGAPGAKIIIAALVQTISNVIDFGMDAQEAVSAPRIYAMDGVTTVEGRIDQAVQDELAAMGHEVKVVDDYYSGMGSANTIVLLENGEYHAAADPRRDAQGVAY